MRGFSGAQRSGIGGRTRRLDRALAARAAAGLALYLLAGTLACAHDLSRSLETPARLDTVHRIISFQRRLAESGAIADPLPGVSVEDNGLVLSPAPVKVIELKARPKAEQSILCELFLPRRRRGKKSP